MKVRTLSPYDDDGRLDIEGWLSSLNAFQNVETQASMITACQIAYSAQEGAVVQEDKGYKIGCFDSGVEMVNMLDELYLDREGLVAAMIYRAVRENHVTLDVARESLSQETAKLVEGVQQMAAISALQTQQDGVVLGQQQEQVENIRKMLVAMVDDVRVGLIKLAERTQAIRAVKNAPKEIQLKVAREVFSVYTPLAHRLGIGSIKWELEDLSFRYLEPDAYLHIAKLLDEKRVDRQAYIEDIIQITSAKLREAGINAQVFGRVKHIYSIWRKMQRKNISFDQLYDIRAIRIIVDTIPECYASLGVVHTQWRNISSEFDDYVANPKPNGYRSLHTAVLGPKSHTFEVQIRTKVMHEEAELGVCAHWRYKGSDNENSVEGYERKIEWFRQVLAWQEETAGSVDLRDLSDTFERDFGVDRIYVFTPKGHVVDIPSGSTPIDFAYHVHTEVGHRCRGAKVDGKIVPLHEILKNGQKVEILTGKESKPNRDWLQGSLGYVQSSRAKSKIRAFFRLQAREDNENAGRALVERELRRLALTSVDYKVLAERLHFSQVEEMYVALGAGDISVRNILTEAEKIVRPEAPSEQDQQLLFASNASSRTDGSADEISVSGVGNLLTTQAQCCKPVPGDAIIGYVSMGRGVIVHRKDCAEFLLSSEKNPDRVVEVSWDVEVKKRYPVDIFIEAYDRTGLLGDVASLLSAMNVNVLRVNTNSDTRANSAHMLITVEIVSLESLATVIAKLENLPNVVRAGRRK